MLQGVIYLDEVKILKKKSNRIVTPPKPHRNLFHQEILNAQLRAKPVKPTEAELIKKLAYQVAKTVELDKQYQELEQANQYLQNLALQDGLTGVSNRRHFDQRLEQEWQRLNREQAPLSLILCDIDYFKLYNDTFGHQSGDECLRQVASGIQRILKRPADLIARYGGEEFAIVLPRTNLEGAIHIVRQIQAEIQKLCIVHHASKVSEFVTLSLGIASVVPELANNPASLIEAADLALYEAKNQGRNRAVIASRVLLDNKEVKPWPNHSHEIKPPVSKIVYLNSNSIPKYELNTTVFLDG